MRHSLVLPLALVALVAPAGSALAAGSVTDTVVTTSVAGVVTITGAGSLPAAPTDAGSATIGGNATMAGSQLTVSDATGATAGWQVTAKYADVDAAGLATLTNALTPGLLGVKNIGGANLSVTPSTAGLGAANAVTGVADSGLTTSGGSLADTTLGRTILSTTGDGRGVTVFNTAYTINLPAKVTEAATLYTGTVVYTVGPKPVSSGS